MPRVILGGRSGQDKIRWVHVNWREWVSLLEISRYVMLVAESGCWAVRV